MDLGTHFDEAFGEPWEFETEPPPPEEWEYEALLDETQQYYQLSPSQFVEQAVMVPHASTRRLLPFSFEERPYLRRVYDTSSRRILLLAGRQIEKTVVETQPILMADGSYSPLSEVRVGDRVSCLLTQEVSPGVERLDGTRMGSSDITWKSRRYKKPCVRITTRQGHVVDVATTHPIRVGSGWDPAGNLRVKDKIAVVRRAGEFGSIEIPDSRVKLTAYMLGDGHCRAKGMSFTNSSCEVLEDFEQALIEEDMDYACHAKRGTTAVAFRLPQKSAWPMYQWFEEDGILGLKSASKFFPDWVFQLSKRKTSLFLNRLWATDGCVKQAKSEWNIEYCSISRKMVDQLQALLWKFGIPSRIRENWPSIYKRRGEKKLAYILRVETQEGVRTFLREIGALDKAEKVDIDTWPSNPNRDTLPLEVSELVHQIYLEVAPRRGDRTLQTCGLRLPRFVYCLTRGKLERFIKFFEEDPRYDQKKVELLRRQLDSDVYWDEIASIEDLGEQWCYDLSVRSHCNYIVKGVVTHNSSTLGFKSFALSCLIPHFKVLFVSPSSTQTKEFSKTRLKEVIETSPVIKKWYPEHLTDNVYEKQAINHSKITLRYAFLNADRVRGLPADMVLLDEFQDILLENIPVIQESASHSPYKYFIYSGTPKSLDNPIQYYWDSYSTQNEWAVPCDRHGTPNNPGSWHWNILGEENIGNHSLVCDRCGEQIFPQHPMAQWVKMGNPDPKYDVFEGFRIPQLMVPWVEWPNLLTKYHSYPRAKFFNEVLGRSFDSGQRPLTRQDVFDNCNPKMELTPEYIQKLQQTVLSSTPVYAGIDWGQDSTNSYTVIALGAYIDGHFQIFFIHRFDGAESDPRSQMDKIKRAINTFRVRRVGADHGGGHFPNDELMRAYGSKRILRYQYSSPSVFIKWDPNLGRFLVHKSEVLSAIFNAIKRRNVFRFPRWKEFATPFASDMLSIFSEYNERTRMTEYKKSPNTTDDSMHAIALCFLASMVDNPRPDILVPSQRVDQVLDNNS